MSTKSTERFSNRVEAYVRARPGYPEAFFDFLRDEMKLPPGAVVADIGSGTGISARPLLERGYAVKGVEPNAAMRGAAEQMLSGYQAFESVDGTAEKTSIASASVDLVLAAQAFHWFEPVAARAEFVRILKPGGHVVLVWNERKLGGTPFLEAYEALLLTYGTDYSAVRHDNVSRESLERFFSPAVMKTRGFENFQELDLDGLLARVNSSSYAPAAGQVGHDELMNGLAEAFKSHARSGVVRIEYDTRVYFGRL